MGITNIASSRLVLDGTSGEEARVFSQQSRIDGDRKEVSLRSPDTPEAFALVSLPGNDCAETHRGKSGGREVTAQKRRSLRVLFIQEQAYGHSGVRLYGTKAKTPGSQPFSKEMRRPSQSLKDTLTSQSYPSEP